MKYNFNASSSTTFKELYITKGEKLMIARYFIYFAVYVLFNLSSNLYAFYEALEDDVIKSKNIPLISGKERQDIIDNGKAAITICTTPLKNIFGSEVSHVSLVFEIKDLLKPQKINLFSIHFGGDGYSSNILKGRPNIDTRRETLAKVHKGAEIKYLDIKDEKNTQYTEIEPIYSKEFSFIVDEKWALYAIKKVHEDRDLEYRLYGGSSWEENTYNCVTYAMKILKDCDINIVFGDYCYLNRATNFLTGCHNYIPKDGQDKFKHSKTKEFVLPEINLRSYAKGDSNSFIENKDTADQSKHQHAVPREHSDEFSEYEGLAQLSTSKEASDVALGEKGSNCVGNMLSLIWNVPNNILNRMGFNSLNTNISSQQNLIDLQVVQPAPYNTFPSLPHEGNKYNYYSDEPEEATKQLKREQENRETKVVPGQFGLADWRNPLPNQLQRDWYEEWQIINL